VFFKGMLCVFFEVGTKSFCTFTLKMIKQLSAPYPGVTKDNHDRRGSAVETLATCSAVCLFHDALSACIGTAETGALIF
jgi:hypothetical protein